MTSLQPINFSVHTAALQTVAMSRPLPRYQQRSHRYLLIFLVSAAAVAIADEVLQLPETYRTPLSDMTHDDHKEWRTEPDQENPWRENGEDLAIKPRLKVEFFPDYTTDSTGNPVSRSLFQNEDEIEKPVSNILEYTW